MLRNKKINIALVGFGIMGMKHLEAIKKCHNVNVSAIIENDKKKLSKLNVKTNYYESISQAFKNHKIDGVIISTPNSEHLKNSLEVIEKNCPLLIEKPITTNSKDALNEVNNDIAEGADIIMVKPGLPYIDILNSLHKKIDVPLAVYQVSGEYSMLKSAASKGFIDYDRLVLEQLFSFKRAGAAMIATYHAKEAVNLLNQI